MGVAYYVVVDSPKPGFDSSLDGKSLAHAYEQLGAAAATLGVKPLDSFLSITEDEVAELLGEESQEEPITETVWELGIARDNGFIYYVSGSDVWRTPQAGKKRQPEKVATGQFQHDPDYLYFIDAQGNVARTAKGGHQPRKGEKWFLASDGLDTVRALKAHFESAGKKHAGVVEDLRRLEEVLGEAANRNLRWHLAIDI